jgi:curved DNA-binding protein
VARDYYDVLGVSRDAGPDELQRAYRRLARQNHPDINSDPAAEERFKEINEANSVLSDPEQRARYDRFGADFRQVPPDWADRASTGRRGARPGAGRGGRRGRPGGFSDFADVGDVGGTGGIDLEDLFGGVFGRGRTGPVPGADQEAELPLTVEEAYHGGRRDISLGDATGSRTYTVTVPRGVVDGQRIRLPGEGGHGINGGPPGDLYLVVRLLPHPRFRVVGHDIHVALPVAPWEAVLGGSVPVPTPGGEAKVTVPPRSSTGRRLRLRGAGMPNERGRPGDLYAELRIVVPRRPTERERELFAELAAVSTFDPRREPDRADRTRSAAR